MEWTERFAPAKVNLFLHVGALAADGYHPVSSLMVFADVGDCVRLRSASQMAFRLEGAFAGALDRGADNLVIRARDRIIELATVAPAPFELVLDKRLPIAAGLGGGSADAAAALALVNERLVAASAGVDAARLRTIARTLGADVTACLNSRSVIAEGRGDEIRPAPPMPVLDAVLVNPRAPSATGAVYRAFDGLPGAGIADSPKLPAAFASAGEVAAFLSCTRNDLEAPAIKLQPAIAEALAALATEPESLFSRMSGSGSTCFALVAGRDAALSLASRVAREHPHWWVEPCRFGLDLAG